MEIDVRATPAPPSVRNSTETTGVRIKTRGPTLVALSVPQARLESLRFFDSRRFAAAHSGIVCCLWSTVTARHPASSRDRCAQGFGSANTCSVVPGFDSGVSWPPAAIATISRPPGVV